MASGAANKKQLNDDHELALILTDEDRGTATQKAVHKEMKKRAAAATKALKNAAKAASKLATKSRKTLSTRKGQGAINKGVGATSLVAIATTCRDLRGQRQGVLHDCLLSNTTYELPDEPQPNKRGKPEKITLAIVYFTPSKVCSKLGSSER